MTKQWYLFLVIESIDNAIFNKKRMFSSMKKHVVNPARKTRFGLYTKIRNLDLSIACQLKLFHNLVVPILTYGCGV